MKKSVEAFFVGFFILLISAQFAFGGESFSICGTGDSQSLLQAAAIGFEAGHEHTVKVNVPESIGSGGGIRAVAADKCELGRVARPLKKKELRFNLNYRVFAKVPVVFVVHPSVTRINSLSYQQIVDIYSGTLTNWQQLGGPDAKIYVANREKDDSSRRVIGQTIIGFAGIDQFAGQVLFSTTKTVSTITKSKNTIGYLPLSAAQHTNLRILKLNNITPNPENIKNGTYPLVVPFGLVWKGKLTGPAADFVDYLTTLQGQKIMSEYGAVQVKP